MKRYFENNTILKKALLATAGLLAFAVMLVALINANKPTVVIVTNSNVAAPVTENKNITPVTEQKVLQNNEAKPADVVVEKNEEIEEVEEETFDDGSGIDLLYSECYDITEDCLNEVIGVRHFNGHKETYYSEHVLPGGGLDIPGRHVADDGTIRDENGYICVAADPEFLEYGATVLTTLGPAKVYDCGCDYGTVDVYVSW